MNLEPVVVRELLFLSLADWKSLELHSVSLESVEVIVNFVYVFTTSRSFKVDVLDNQTWDCLVEPTDFLSFGDQRFFKVLFIQVLLIDCKEKIYVKECFPSDLLTGILRQEAYEHVCTISNDDIFAFLQVIEDDLWARLIKVGVHNHWFVFLVSSHRGDGQRQAIPNLFLFVSIRQALHEQRVQFAFLFFHPSLFYQFAFQNVVEVKLIFGLAKPEYFIVVALKEV